MASGRNPLVNVGAVVLAGCALAGCKPFLSAMGFKSGGGGTATALSTPPAALPAFEFRGLRPGVTTYAESRKSLALHYCSDAAGAASCDLRDQSVGNVSALEASAVFERGVLSAIRITYPSGLYARLRDAVVESYGQPCEARGVDGADRSGMLQAGAVTAWCFQGGKLMLVEHDGGEDGRSIGRLAFTLPRREASLRIFGRSRL